ncbi:WD repeat-containing protein 81, partial [Mortierella sp. GBA43]
MFGAGFDAQELAALIERDLHLHVAFPCFPLETTRTHTACCVVQKSWLEQLQKGTATHLYNGVALARDSAGANSSTGVTSATASSNFTEPGNSGGEVNVFINVISKTKPLQQDNWTRARAFSQVGPKSSSAVSNPPTQKSYTTLTSVSSNDEWNLTVEAYVRELLDIDLEEDNLLKTGSKPVCPDTQHYHKEFQSILESNDADTDPDESHNGGPDPWENNKILIEHVLDILYPTTLRYKLVHPSHVNASRGHSNDDSGEGSGHDSPNHDISDGNNEDSSPGRNDDSDDRHYGDDNMAIASQLVLVERDIDAKTKPAPSNIAAATVIIESDSAHYCLSPHRSGGAAGLTTLQDLLRFNPGNLNTSLKKGFLVYQLLKAVEGLHRNGLIHGSIKPSNIYIDENLWITLTGIKCSVPYQDNLKPSNTHRTLTTTVNQGLPKEIQDESTVMKWVKGDISNFTYLMILNHAAGRRHGDPNVHPIFPWVTDFTGAKVEDGWRDFTKTKFRLNKGDEQLDVTYDGPIPHHITDILSDITYYVYMARQIPIPVLCQFVRSKYEANEYPSSIRRLYEWTPDECIPEFYTDSSIFKSIHSDMPDMALPTWADTPEDFIRIHREALESEYVSRHLHEWIDLTFGYRLSGPGAMEAKNVALSLFPGQSEFMKHGIIQLFTDPHPQRLSNWSLSKAEFLKSQAEKQTALERASKTIKRRSVYRPQTDRPQFVDKVSDLLFRPAGPTRSKSMRQLPGPRPSSLVINNSNESVSTAVIIGSPPKNGVLSPKSILAQDTTLALATTRPEALIQFIQSESIELSKDLKGALFTEELEHFESTFHFGSKYHFMNSDASQARILADAPTSNTGNSATRQEDSFEYMQSWDVYCLGDVFKQIYLAQEVPNNSIDMALRPHTTLLDLTKSQDVPVVVGGTIMAMLKEDWKSRPLIDDILQRSIPALSLQSPTISMFVPTLMAEIYEFLAMFYVCPVSTQMELANRWIGRICAFEDETFDIALPVFVHLFTNEGTRLNALSIFPKLGQRLGIQRTKTCLLKPIIALFEAFKPLLPAELLVTSVFTEFLRRFGSDTFLQRLFPYYLESLSADYGPGEAVSDDNSSGSSFRAAEGMSASATTSAAIEDDLIKKSTHESIPALGRVASDAFVGICRSIGPILTSKHVMRPFSRLAFKDPVSLPLLKDTLGGIAQEFGSTFALVQFSHMIHLIDSSSKTFNTRTSNIIRNLLGMLGSLVPHMYDTQLVTELRNGGSDLIYRLIEPSPRKPTSRSESQADLRLAIAPILQKYFSGFGPETDEVSTKTTTAMDVKKNEQMMYAYGQLCSCVGQDAMQSMIPASEAIERLIAAKLASKEFGNSPLRSLGSITAQGKFVLSTSGSSTFWQHQKNQQARDAANSKKAAFSTRDLWSATSA